MYVFRANWFAFGCLLVLQATRLCQAQEPEFTPPPPKDHGPTTQAPVGLFIVPFPQAAAGSIVDVNPNVIAAIQAGGSPFAAFVQSDTGESSFPPNTNWTRPESLNVISSFINRTSSSSPSGVGQNEVEIKDENTGHKDPVLLFAPPANKPKNPNLLHQLLSNAPGLNNSFATIANLAQSKPGQKPPTPPANDQNGFGSFLGAPSNRPSNDEATSGSTSAPLNPIQSLVESSQASWNNATGAAQGIVVQLGSNGQNGIANVLGINVNRPSNDEATSTPEPDQQSASPTTSTTGSGFSNPFGPPFNSSQISIQNGLVGSWLANLNRPGASKGAAIEMVSKIDRNVQS